ncbi:phage tail tape measure protein [Fusobacterium gonidiaformans]|uniref:phage tail tape measure protein n=1 Tax=Fusobacterium gonidiaformans TaxID=849 RepID=UPI00307F4F9A
MIDNEVALSVGIEFDTETGDTEAKIKRVETCIGDIGKTSVKAGDEIAKFPKKVGVEAEKTLQKLELLNQKISKIRTVTQPLAKTGKYALVGLTGAATVAIKKYADFEAGILKVRTISKKSFEDIESDVRNLAKRYGLSTAEVAEGNYQLVSSMGDVKESAQILDTTAKLSIAGFTDYASAMNGLVAVMNGYKMEAKDAASVADILMTVQNRGVTTINELQGSLSEVTSVAYNANVGFKDIAAAMATITSNKVGTAEAVTGLKGAILELMQDGSQAAKHFQKATGEAFDKFMNNHSLVEAIQMLDEYSKKTGISLANIFGNVRAGTAFMNLSGSNLKKFTEDLKAMSSATGTADKAMKELDKGAKRTFEKLKAQAHESALAIGKALVPQVKKLTEWLSKVNWEKIFSEQNVGRIVNTGKQIAIVAGALWGIDKALKSIQTVSTAIMTGKSFIAWLAGGSAGAVALITGSVVAGAAYTLKKVNDSMRDKRITESERRRQENLRAYNKKHYWGTNYNPNNSNDGFLSAPTGIYSKKEEKATSPVLASGYDKTDKKGSKSKADRDELQEFIKTYKKEMKDLPKFWDIIGLSKKEKLENYLDMFKSNLQRAIELGSESLTSSFSKSFQDTKNKLNDMEAQNILKTFHSKSEKNAKETDSSKRLSKEIENTETAIQALRELDEDRYADAITNLEKQKDFYETNEKLQNEEIRKKQEYNDKLNATINALNTAANGFSQLASATGSKTIGGFANILGSAASIGSAMKDWGGMSSIAGMFSKAGSFSGGMASIGAAAGIAAAGIGIAATIGSLIGRSGKKKAAKIDARNKENEEAYKKQISALQQLTQAIEKNSERMKTFADRVFVDISKNPTLNYIAGGKRNFDLMHDSMIGGKHFADITALEKGSARYRSGFRHKHKDTYTKVDISEAELLKYLGFDKTELDAFTDAEMKQLDKVLDKVNHETLRRATGRNLTESSIEEWKKQVHEFTKQLEFLEKEKADLFRGSTLESFAGMEFRTEKELIKEYTERFKELGLEGEKYTETIKEMAKNNQVLVTSMLDVRNNAIEGLATGNGGFLTAAKSYFEKIYKNASSVAYDVAFSDIDSYMSEMFKTISDKLLDVKKTGKLDFSNLLSDFDFAKFKNLELSEKEIKKSLDTIKRQLLDSGVDLSIINKLLPQSDFNNRLNDLTTSLSAAMSAGLETHKYESFTETLGKSLYDSTKNGLVKAFSESALYQGMIEKFIDTEDLRSKLEKAGSFQEAFNLTENIMKKFGYEMEANGFGGFDAIGNLAKEEKKLGNAYYQDKASNVEISVVNNFYREVYGLEDLQGIITDQAQKAIELWQNRPRGDK